MQQFDDTILFRSQPMHFSHARQQMIKGLTDGIFTGAVLLARQGDETLFHEPFGAVGEEGTAPVTVETLFDLASLTKVIATTPAWMILTDRERGILDEPLTRWLPKVPEDKAHITPRHLLAHSSGLPPWRPYYLFPSANTPRDKFTCDKILSEPLQYHPGLGTVYSDLGFMLLAFLIKMETGTSLDVFLSEEIFGPLGLGHEMKFRPTSDENGIALTRKADPAGLVNDLNARALGGVAGHAGLFGTARGVAEVASRVLLSLKSDDGFFDRSIARLFCTRTSCGERETRPLGFDTPASEGSSSGRFFSAGSLGHTGFTGTSFWMDPETDLIVVLLTNRVYLGESDFRIKSFRPLVHDAVMGEMVQGGLMPTCSCG